MADSSSLDFSLLKKGLVLGPNHRRFRLLKATSNSPIGQVWHAEDLDGAEEGQDPETLALEFINPALLHDAGVLNTFKTLATQAKALHHRHIAETYGYFQSREGWLFVAMQAVRTRSLARILMEDGYQQLTTDKVRAILSQTAQAVDFIASHRLSHGDLSPWNLMITRDSGVKLVNPVFRQPLLKKVQDDGHRILNGEYHAPEAFVSAPMPASADIYSLGCLVYQLLCGAPPFSPQTPLEERAAEALEKPAALSEVQWELVRAALSDNPGDRPREAAELVKALFAREAQPADTDSSSSVEMTAPVPKRPLSEAPPNAVMAPRTGVWLRRGLVALGGFALGVGLGYYLAMEREQARTQELLSQLTAVQQLLGRMPSPDSKVLLQRRFAKLRQLAGDSALMAALQPQVEAYQARLSRDPLKPADPVGEQSPDPGNEASAASTEASPDSSDALPPDEFQAGALFKDEILPGVFGPRMLVLPAGSFRMGDLQGQGDDNEKPVHEVRIQEAFALSQREVTFADYDLFALNTGRPLPDDEGWGRGERPVINISWNDANAYAHWLRERTGLNYRLPTEAEWEYAARAGTKTAFWWGTELGRNRANCDNCGSVWDGRKTAPVASFEPNPFGLYDMNGNVYEWVADCYNGTYAGAPADGSSWDVGLCNYRVMRGGSWFDIGRLLRSASRYRHPPDASRNAWGVRLALDLDQGN